MEIAQRAAEERAEVDSARDVDGRERLVEDQHARCAGQRTREGDPLALAPGEVSRFRVRGDPRSKPLQELERVCARGARSGAARPHRERHVLQHAEVREQHAVLERALLGREVVDRLGVEEDPAGRSGDQPRDRLDDRGLAGAVGTEERECLTVAGGERRGDRHVAATNLDLRVEGHRAVVSGAP